jgi:hypothetical protein
MRNIVFYLSFSFFSSQINEQDKERMNDESVNIKRKYLSRRYLFGPRSPIDDETQNAVG